MFGDNRYIVNNTSFLSSVSKHYDRSQVKQVMVCLNFLDNKAHELYSVLESGEQILNLSLDDDLYIADYKYEEYDGPFVNLIIYIESESGIDLTNLFFDFRDNKAMLVMDNQNRIYLTKTPVVINTVKKVYPVAIEVGENQYMVHHNFFNGLLPLRNDNGNWSLEVCNAKTYYVIRDLVLSKFDSPYITGYSMESVLKDFYNAFI